MHNRTYVYMTITLLVLYTAHCVSNTATIDNSQIADEAAVDRQIPFAQTVTNATTVGAGNNVLIGKVGRTLTFKTLVAGSGVTLTPSSTELQIAASASTPSYTYIIENATTLLTIAAGATVLFTNAILSTSDITYNSGTGNITFANAGVYQITYTLSMTDSTPQSFQLFLDGVAASDTKFLAPSGGSGDNKTCGEIIVAITAGQVLSLRNSGSATITVPPVSNTSAFVRISLIAQKIA